MGIWGGALDGMCTWSGLIGAVVRAMVWRSDDPYIAGSNQIVGHGCLSFGWDRKIRGPVSKQLWHVKEYSLLKVVSAKIRSKLQLSHWEWLQPPDSWKIARAAANTQTFTVLRPAQEFFTSTGERLQSVGLCLVLRAYKLVLLRYAVGHQSFLSHPKDQVLDPPFQKFLDPPMSK